MVRKPEGQSRGYPFNLRDLYEDIAMSDKKPSSKALTVVADDPDELKGELKVFGGSRSDELNTILVSQVVSSLWVKNSDAEEISKLRSAALFALGGIAPRDELEGMIAGQLVACHNASMECFRRAMIGEQSLEGRRENLNQANKLSRTYAMLLETLNRHRGKGQQKVTVEHVHVHAGGQAVVGMVAPPPALPGGGDRINLEEQPHAKQIAYAPQLTMPCPDPNRDAVPVTGDEERPLPDARRHVTGRSKGK